ncbi:MAG: hypothetical protein AAGI11_20825 [Pseudomonadota bacterium]
MDETGVVQPGYRTRGVTGSSQFLDTMAHRVRAAYGTSPIPSLAPDIPYPNIGVGYAVQETNTRVWLSQGQRLAGRKIAYVSPRVCEETPIPDPQPVFGMLFDNMLKPDGCKLKMSSFMRPRISA